MAHLALEIPDDQLVGAIAREQALSDATLDGMEAALQREPDPDRAAALALSVGRAGRRGSARVLAEVRGRLQAMGARDEALVLELSLELLCLRPGPQVEAAERGYRFHVPREKEPVYVEDPVAAHWHAANAWGPPLRPNLGRSARLFLSDEDGPWALRHAEEGGVVVVLLSGQTPGPAPAALRLTRAGYARDAGLRTLIRWSEVRGFGFMEADGRARSVAVEWSERIDSLPAPRGPSPSALQELMRQLAARGRGQEETGAETLPLPIGTEPG